MWVDYGESGRAIHYYTIKTEDFLWKSKEWQSEIEKEKDKEEPNLERIQLLEFYIGLKETVYQAINPVYVECLNIFFDNVDVNDSAWRIRKKNEIADFKKKHECGSLSKVYGLRTEAINSVYQILVEHEAYLGEFYRFDVHSFLKYAHTWPDKLAAARDKADSSIGIKPVAFDGTGGGKKTYHINDSTLNDVIALEDEMANVHRYEKYMTVLSDGIQRLKYNIQKELIHRMFLPEDKDKRRSKAIKVEQIADKYHVSISVVERHLKYAKQDIQQYIERRHFGRIQ